MPLRSRATYRAVSVPIRQLVRRFFGRGAMPGSGTGHLRQMLAASVHTSIFALRVIRQRALIQRRCR
jgi:hypothetical protein